jgi:hypothetical protein
MFMRIATGKRDLAGGAKMSGFWIKITRFTVHPTLFICNTCSQRKFKANNM